MLLHNKYSYKYLKIFKNIIIYSNSKMDELQKKIEELKIKNMELEERLKKYTNGDNHKRYYEKNKDKIKEQGTTYLKKLKEENPEKLKEYRRTYYLKKKEKMKQQEDNNKLN
jgi:predicted MPP superfamily phosphohydrolase